MNGRLPGELITLGGDRLHIVQEGSGTPPLLLSAGLGGAWFDWRRVVALLRDRYRVIGFDRPGLGGSPPAARPATLRREADRLSALARWAGPPVIVVAHSFAGLHAEAFARLYPELTRGLVLVDPSAEHHTPRYARTLARLAAPARLVGAAAGALRLPRLTGPLLHRLAMRTLCERPDAVPPEFLRAVCARGDVLGTLLAEDAVYRQVAADLVTLRRHRPFPGVPLRVITALRGGGERWRRAHATLAAFSPEGRQIVLPDTGHMVQIDRPEVVAEAVRGL